MVKPSARGAGAGDGADFYGRTKHKDEKSAPAPAPAPCAEGFRNCPNSGKKAPAAGDARRDSGRRHHLLLRPGLSRDAIVFAARHAILDPHCVHT